MAVSLRESVDQVSDPGNLDASVEEVFQLMLGVDLQAHDAPSRLIEPESVTAVVGFGGLLSGACVFRTGGAAATADCRAHDRDGVRSDRRHREGRDRRNLQHAGRSVEGQGSRPGRELWSFRSGRHHRPGLQAPCPGAGVPTTSPLPFR